MPAKNLKINVLLEKPLYKSIEYHAKKEDISLSIFLL